MDYNKYYKKVKIDRDKNIDVNESRSIDKAIYILLLTALFIVPVFIKAHLGEFYSPKLTFIGSSMQSDIFSYYKYIFLVIITSLIGLLFLYKVIFLEAGIASNKINFLVGILAVLIVLSGAFSPYKTLALHGIFNRHEGTVTYICYLMIFFVAANMKFSIKQLHGFLYVLYPFVIINMVIGLLLFYGKNPLEIGWVKSFILGSLLKEGQLSEGATLWATVSNPNYISGIGSVLSILFLTWAIFDKNKIRSGLNVIIATISFMMVLTSFSTSGFLTTLALLPILVVLIFLNEQRLKSFLVLITFVILTTAIYTPLVNKNERVWNESFGFIVNTVKDSMPKNETKDLTKEKPETKATVDSDKESQEPNETNGDSKTSVQPEGNKQSLSIYQIPQLPNSSYSAGSGRAYIWEKTVEVAMERPFIGYGLDTYTFVFPQDDIDKIAGLNTYNIVVDKPHNMYLGILVGSGIITVFLFILLVGLVLLKGTKTIIRRNASQQEKPVLFALFTASIAYLVQGLFNDSVVGSAVIFWFILGMLVSIMFKNEVKES